MGRSSTIEEEHNCAQLYQLSTLAGRVKNPIWLAEKVLEHSPHCLLASEGAERFALSHGITPVPNESLISPDAKKAWNHFKSNGPNYDKLSTQEALTVNETGHDTIGRGYVK